MSKGHGGRRRPVPPTIRPAGPADAEAMREIYNDAVRSTTATFDTEPRSLADQLAWLAYHDARHPVFVAESGGGVVGWASLSPWSERRAYDGTAEISVYVGRAWRRRGFGRALITEILGTAATVGLHTVLARVVEGNPASRALHLLAGFRVVGTMHEVGYKFRRYLHVELMELVLEPRRIARGLAARTRHRQDAGSRSSRNSGPGERRDYFSSKIEIRNPPFGRR
jgi:L-amino acid N-acyltransferase